MQFKAILVLLATTKLVASLAIDNTSPKPISLEASELQRRSACAVAGVVNGQCGRFYRGTGCNDQIGAIDPGRCQGTCYFSSDPIGSLKAVGDGTFGTNCHLYYDNNCQQQAGLTGNAIFGGGKCLSAPVGRVGHSFMCFYRC